MNVVIVDDDPDITKLYMTALEVEALNIDTYNDPKKDFITFQIRLL